MVSVFLLLLIVGEWGTDMPLSRDTIGAEGAYTRSHTKRVAVDSRGIVHAVWPRADGFGIKYRRYNGFEWEAETVLVRDAAVEPTLAVDKNDRVHLVYGRPVGDPPYGPHYKSCINGFWSPETVIFRDTVTQRGELPALAVDTLNRLHVVWSSWSSRFYLYRRFNGTSWDSTIRLCSWRRATPVDFRWTASIAADVSGDVHVVWFGDTTGNFEIYYIRCRNGIWGRDTMLTNAPEASIRPKLACDSRGRVHLVWVDHRLGNSDIFYKRYNGTSWEPDTPLVRVNCPKDWPNVCVDDADRVHVVWTDWRDGGGTEIYYKYFDGTRWSQDYRLTSCWGYSYLPFIAADLQRRLHVTWTDSRDNIGLGMPYYKRGWVSSVDEMLLAGREARFRVSPNPFSHSVLIEPEEPGGELRIFDRAGRLVARQQLRSALRWDGRSLPGGVYFIEYRKGLRHTSVKVIKT